MTFQPWIRGMGAVGQGEQTGLQRSHDLSAMDTMAHGKETGKETGLQRSHDLSAMDTWMIFGMIGGVVLCFKGAMTFQPWIQGAIDPACYCYNRFKGAMTFQPWIHDMSLHNLCNTKCFKGAMTFQPWIPYDISRLSRDQTTLQRSHDLSAMDTSISDMSTPRARRLQRSHDLSAMDTNPLTKP